MGGIVSRVRGECLTVTHVIDKLEDIKEKLKDAKDDDPDKKLLRYTLCELPKCYFLNTVQVVIQFTMFPTVKINTPNVKTPEESLIFLTGEDGLPTHFWGQRRWDRTVAHVLIYNLKDLVMGTLGFVAEAVGYMGRKAIEGVTKKA